MNFPKETAVRSGSVLAWQQELSEFTEIGYATVRTATMTGRGVNRRYVSSWGNPFRMSFT